MRISDWSSDVCSSDLVAYIIKKYEEAGLKPGNNGEWTQDVPLVEITAKNATPLTFTGGKTPVTAQYAKDYVAFSYRVTPKTAVKDSDVVFVGYGINAPEKGWRSEEHTSELQSLTRRSYAASCSKKKNTFIPHY